MFGTVLRQTLPGLSTSRWNQNRSGKHREQEICCLVQENPPLAFIRCSANSQILAQEKPKLKGTRELLKLDQSISRARLVLAKERILECLVSLMRCVQNSSEFGVAVQIIQQRVFFNIWIAEETRFNAHSQHV
jgi:hypothetical protein